MGASGAGLQPVGIIGAGRVGAVLGAALQRRGHPVTAAVGISDASRGRAETLLPGVPLVPPDEVVRRADLILLALPDDLLDDVVSGLAATGTWRQGHTVVHTSGRHGLQVLEPARAQGATTMALHPALTFTGTPTDLERLPGTSWAVTCRPADVPAAEGLVARLGGRAVRVDEEERVLYHAALTHGANHLVTLVAEAADLLRSAGVTEPGRVLRPLLQAAFDGALEDGDAALTGPVRRGDSGTVSAHLGALEAAAPDAVAAYRALSVRTTQRALGSGMVTPSRARALLDLLGETEEDPCSAPC